MKVRTIVTDKKDSRNKKASAREFAETNPKIALAMAEAIAANPSLLDGLTVVVTRLAKHEEAATILDEVFMKHGKKYPRTYRAYVDVRLGFIK